MASELQATALLMIIMSKSMFAKTMQIQGITPKLNKLLQNCSLLQRQASLLEMFISNN
jgi:hypothetical protein